MTDRTPPPETHGADMTIFISRVDVHGYTFLAVGDTRENALHALRSRVGERFWDGSRLPEMSVTTEEAVHNGTPTERALTP